MTFDERRTVHTKNRRGNSRSLQAARRLSERVSETASLQGSNGGTFIENTRQRTELKYDLFRLRRHWRDLRAVWRAPSRPEARAGQARRKQRHTASCHHTSPEAVEVFGKVVMRDRAE
jgi:hypothetical protein